MKKFQTKFCGLLILILCICSNVFGQTTIESLNKQLRDMLINLKKAPYQTPFLYEMSSHIIDFNYYTVYNDSTLMPSSMYFTMYEEMRSSAYDTTILKPADSIISQLKKVSTNDTVFMSILDADFAIFKDSAFTIEGEYYHTTEDTVYDVIDRIDEPFYSRSLFLSTLNTPTSYFRKVVYVLDTNYIFARNNLLANYSQSDLDPTYARWKVDFGDGVGWREFNPKTRNVYVVTYPDTGLYHISTGIFYCDPYPLCNLTPSKLSKTAIYIINNKIPVDPDLTYEFSNITVGLYKGCGEEVNGVYIPNKPFIIIEGIDLNNSRYISKMYDEYVESTSKRLNELGGTGYDFYFVNFNNSKIDMRDNARGVIELIDYLKSIMNTNEQFVVLGESMGGIIARYALTYMETSAYQNEPNVSKPEQLHNTRLLITNDSPHQGAYVPIAYQMLYKNVTNSIVYKVLKKAKYFLPVFDDLEEMSKLLESTAVQQLLSYHVDAYGQHGERVSFMNDLINMNNNTNGFPEYCKLLALSDGLLTGQHQLKTNNNILSPGEKIFNLNFKVKTIIFRFIKIDHVEYNLNLFAVDKNNPNKIIFEASDKIAGIKIKGCIRKLLRLNVIGFYNCAINYINGTPLNAARNVNENYETTPGGLFSAYNMISNKLEPKVIDLFFYTGKFNIDKQNGNMNFVLTSSTWMPSHYVITPEIEINLSLPYFNFSFIPVQSAIDLDYSKSQNFPHDVNLLSGDVQNTLFPYTPFHVISGFENFTNNYPSNLNNNLGNMNWSHGFFTNYTIDINNGHGYLTREIGDETIYLNNLNLGTRLADFKFKNIYLGVNNPNYKYHLALPPLPTPQLNGTYSKDLPFKFREPGAVYVYYENKYINGDNKQIDGPLTVEQITIDECRLSRPLVINIVDSIRNSISEIEYLDIYPNPFENEIIILNLDRNVNYNLKIINSIGQQVLSKTICNLNNEPVYINVSELNHDLIYTIIVNGDNGHSVSKKIIKKN